MKHSTRLARLQERQANRTPKGMRKIVVNGTTYFWRAGNYGASLTIITGDRKPFHEVNLQGDCTWHPSDVRQEILRKLAS